LYRSLARRTRGGTLATTRRRRRFLACGSCVTCPGGAWSRRPPLRCSRSAAGPGLPTCSRSRSTW